MTISAGLIRRLIALLVAALLVVSYWAWQEGYPPLGPGEDKWTGVFLTNGQAYFGHWYNAPGEEGILREVYYVLATQLQSQDPNRPAQTQLSLQRLGGEIHGPQPVMRIQKRQVLFTEDLRADSPLVSSIKQLKSGGGQPPATQAPAPAATATPAATTSTPRPPTASPSPTR